MGRQLYLQNGKILLFIDAMFNSQMVVQRCIIFVRDIAVFTRHELCGLLVLVSDVSLDGAFMDPLITILTLHLIRICNGGHNHIISSIVY